MDEVNNLSSEGMAVELINEEVVELLCSSNESEPGRTATEYALYKIIISHRGIMYRKVPETSFSANYILNVNPIFIS